MLKTSFTHNPEVPWTDRETHQRRAYIEHLDLNVFCRIYSFSDTPRTMEICSFLMGRYTEIVIYIESRQDGWFLRMHRAAGSVFNCNTLFAYFVYALDSQYTIPHLSRRLNGIWAIDTQDEANNTCNSEHVDYVVSRLNHLNQNSVGAIDWEYMHGFTGSELHNAFQSAPNAMSIFTRVLNESINNVERLDPQNEFDWEVFFSLSILLIRMRRASPSFTVWILLVDKLEQKISTMDCDILAIYFLHEMLC